MKDRQSGEYGSLFERMNEADATRRSTSWSDYQNAPYDNGVVPQESAPEEFRNVLFKEGDRVRVSAPHARAIADLNASDRSMSSQTRARIAIVMQIKDTPGVVTKGNDEDHTDLFVKFDGQHSDTAMNAESLVPETVEEGVSGRRHRRRMNVKEAAQQMEFDILLGDKVLKRVTGTPEEPGYVYVNVDQLRGEVPDSDRLYLEDDQGMRYVRVMSHLPEDDTVLFRQL